MTAVTDSRISSSKALNAISNHKVLAAEPCTGVPSREPHKNLVLRLAIAFVQAMGALLSGIATQLLAPVTTVTLRAAVRSRAFWERGLARAW